jgi:hypothetical protein
VSLQTGDCAIIDGVIRGIIAPERRIQVLHSTVRLPEQADITNAEQRRLDFDALRVGQVVELTGTYSRTEGFLPSKVQIRRDASPAFEEIQGRIDAVSPADAAFSVLGLTVGTDAGTQVKDKRKALA